MSIRNLIRNALYVILLPVFLVTGLLLAGIVRGRRSTSDKPHLVWGSTPLINNRHWSQSMRAAGYSSETFIYSFYASINQRSDWDRVLTEEWIWCPGFLKPLLAFLQSLLAYDVFFISADGFFIGTLPVIWRLQAPLLRLAGKKIVFIPYGGDTYVYRRIRSTTLAHGLLASYPEGGRNQEKIQTRLDYWCRHADVCIPAVMGMDGFGRWDAILASILFLDLNEWKASPRHSEADGLNAPVRIYHAPNHRGFKGTEFVIEAVRILQSEGLRVELILLEKIQNAQVRAVLSSEADILVEQLIFTGHGLNGLEGMACGLPVVSNLEDDDYLLPVRRWSFFSECPIVSATPENLVHVLRKLVTRPKLRAQLGQAGRQYAEKYHGLDSAVYLFEAVIDRAYGRREPLINMYHPLLSEYTKRSPQIVPPLVNNRIVD